MNIIEKKEILIKIGLIIIAFLLTFYLVYILLVEDKEEFGIKNEEYIDLNIEDIEKMLTGKFNEKEKKNS